MSGEEIDANRLRNWARAYQRLMLGGMAREAHTAAVDDFADDEGRYPHITAFDVLALLDERDALRAELALAKGCWKVDMRAARDAEEALDRVRALADRWGRAGANESGGFRVLIAALRSALDPQ